MQAAIFSALLFMQKRLNAVLYIGGIEFFQL